MIGTDLNRHSPALMRAVHSKPSMWGIWQSINTTSSSCPFISIFSSCRIASLPSSAVITLPTPNFLSTFPTSFRVIGSSSTRKHCTSPSVLAFSTSEGGLEEGGSKGREGPLLTTCIGAPSPFCSTSSSSLRVCKVGRRGAGGKRSFSNRGVSLPPPVLPPSSSASPSPTTVCALPRRATSLRFLSTLASTSATDDLVLSPSLFDVITASNKLLWPIVSLSLSSTIVTALTMICFSSSSVAFWSMLSISPLSELFSTVDVPPSLPTKGVMLLTSAMSTRESSSTIDPALPVVTFTTTVDAPACASASWHSAGLNAGKSSYTNATANSLLERRRRRAEAPSCTTSMLSCPIFLRVRTTRASELSSIL
mmetsp:Transcript_35087/g.91010  ORF Transcript_35087/g.91010 Transcript_35087/m.91010 type:complete len:366 (-) Transcript_35087:2404-3501(-)